MHVPSLISASIALVLGGCAAMNVAPPVTPALMVASGGVSAATLKTGREVFGGRCTACHSAEPVGKHSVAEWRRIIAVMAPRAKLDAAQRSALLAYIEAARAM